MKRQENLRIKSYGHQKWKTPNFLLNGQNTLFWSFPQFYIELGSFPSFILKFSIHILLLKGFFLQIFMGKIVNKWDICKEQEIKVLQICDVKLYNWLTLFHLYFDVNTLSIIFFSFNCPSFTSVKDYCIKRGTYHISSTL